MLAGYRPGLSGLEETVGLRTGEERQALARKAGKAPQSRHDLLVPPHTYEQILRAVLTSSPTTHTHTHVRAVRTSSTYEQYVRVRAVLGKDVWVLEQLPKTQ